MKKILIFMLSVVMTVTIIGCNNEEVTVGDEGKASEAELKSSNYFDGKVAETDGVKISITDTKVIEVGEEGNEYGDKPIFAIWYETTNKTDEEVTPLIWINIFEMVQDNNDDMVNVLGVGDLPDMSHGESQMANIKQDGTVENSISYELDDMETPVTLIADIDGEEIGRAEFDIE